MVVNIYEIAIAIYGINDDHDKSIVYNQRDEYDFNVFIVSYKMHCDVLLIGDVCSRHCSSLCCSIAVVCNINLMHSCCVKSILFLVSIESQLRCAAVKSCDLLRDLRRLMWAIAAALMQCIEQQNGNIIIGSVWKVLPFGFCTPHSALIHSTENRLSRPDVRLWVDFYIFS